MFCSFALDSPANTAASHSGSDERRLYSQAKSRQNSLNPFHSEIDFSTFRQRGNCQVSDLCDVRGRGRFQFLKDLKNLV